jgi:hypothetical protein
MKALLKLTGEELLKNERVIRAYWGMNNILLDKCDRISIYYAPGHSTTGWMLTGCTVLDPIPSSLSDVAFAMRDACIGLDIQGTPMHWNRRLGELIGHDDTGCLLLADARHWIIAACLSYEATQGKM